MADGEEDVKFLGLSLDDVRTTQGPPRRHPQSLWQNADKDWGHRLSEISYQQLLKIELAMMKNWTGGREEWRFDLVSVPAVRGIITVIYIVIILVGLVSNAIVIVVAAKMRKKAQTVTNVLVVNLALSDLGLCTFSLPIQLHYQLTDRWVFGEPLCKVVFSAFALPMYLSTVTILLIAIDRYWLIIYPFKDRLSVRTALILVSVNVIGTVVMSMPVMHFTSLYVIDDPDLDLHKNLCIESWPSIMERQVYSVLTFIFQFCLPLVLTTGLYLRIYTRLRKRPLATRQHRSSSSSSSSHPPHPSIRTNKTNKILIAIVANFIACWLPWNLFSLVTEIDHTTVRGPHFKLVDLSLKGFAMGSACINPLLYCWLNDNLKKDLSAIAVKLKIYAAREPTQNAEAMPRFEVQPPSRDAEPRSYAVVDNVRTASLLMERSSSAPRHSAT